MFDHPVVDVALGLVFFYVILSLVASAVQEWIASVFGLRSKNLNAGIKRLVGDVYAQAVYDHPLVKNLAKKNQLPSYITPETLSAVLLEVVAKDKSEKSYLAHAAGEVRGLINKFDQNDPLRDILEPLVADGDNAVNDLREKLAAWFDEGMTRISGWYRRRVKLIIFIIAAGVTLTTNASSIRLAEELWRNDALRATVAAQAQAAAAREDIAALQTTNLNSLKAFPIGWETPPSGGVDWLKAILGWLITIAAVSLGAPFWFDLLGKVSNLKGAGGEAQRRQMQGGERS